ncbi:MAG: Ribosome-recycling factor [Chlamydiia bacterium]|nr:Ribosome-recycling factor [Chlamydiia bacterium]MCH9616236.1 Ribosome-recycling factor [Chlamydiia bacterium]MCH9629778.1 Ribosome-recycling factor [Chlamydiia bacterium]
MVDQTMKAAETGMQDAVDHFKKELQGLRTGRANPGLIETITVEVYGTEMKVKDLATVSVPEARQLLITPYDGQTAGPISKGIEKANIGLQPILEGNVVRVPIPALNEEIRKDIVKQAKKKAEEAKVSVRESRRKGNDTVKKLKTAGDINEDDVKKGEKRIQELTDKFCKVIDQVMTDKEKELMSV